MSVESVAISLIGPALVGLGAYVGVVRTLTRTQTVQEKDKEAALLAKAYSDDQLRALRLSVDTSVTGLAHVNSSLAGLTSSVTGLQSNFNQCQTRHEKATDELKDRVRELEHPGKG